MFARFISTARNSTNRSRRLAAVVAIVGVPVAYALFKRQKTDFSPPSVENPPNHVKSVAMMNLSSRKRDVLIIDVAGLGLVGDVQKLIDRGDDVNEMDDFGNSAVLVAACRNDVAMMKVLIKNGARVDIPGNYFGLSPMGWATFHASDEMIDLLKGAIIEESKKDNG